MNDSAKQYAGFWIRLGATLIDSVFFMIVMYVPLSLIYGAAYWQSQEQGSTLSYGIWDVLFRYILPISVTVWCWLKYRGTPGKIMLKLEVVDAETQGSLTTGQAVGRYFAYIPATFMLCLGFIWIGLDNKKQGWHDKLANTVVLKGLPEKD